MLSHVRLFAIPETVAHQAPLSMGFPRQEYWSGLPFPSPIWLTNSIPRYISEKKKKTPPIWKYTYTLVFIAALFTIAKARKQPKCPSIYEWVNEGVVHTHTHTMEYYSAIKKNEILPFSAIRMDLREYYAKWNKSDRLIKYCLLLLLWGI